MEQVDEHEELGHDEGGVGAEEEKLDK